MTILRLLTPLFLSALLFLSVHPIPTLTASDEVERPSSVGLGVYRPAFPDRLTAVEEYERASGAQVAIVHWFALWGGWKREFSQSDLETVSRRGSLPMISWEPWSGQANDPGWSLREAVLSGRNDAYIETWAHGLAAYRKPVLLRFAHEMHHQTYPWAIQVNGNTADDYTAAWRHVHGIFERAGATNVQWVWNPNTMGAATAAEYAAIYPRLYPGDAYVDWIGLDIYNTGPELDWGAPFWRSFPEILQEPYAAITQMTSKPLILPEVGTTEIGGSKAEWIQGALAEETLNQFPRLRAIVWYDIHKEQAWQLGSSPEALAAWHAASARLHVRDSGPQMAGCMVAVPAC